MGVAQGLTEGGQKANSEGTVRKLERSRSKNEKNAEVKGLVRFWCKKMNLGPCKGPLKLFPRGSWIVGQLRMH